MVVSSIMGLEDCGALYTPNTHCILAITGTHDEERQVGGRYVPSYH